MTASGVAAEHASLLAALSAFQGEDGLTFAKTKIAKLGSYEYKYADLGDILPVVRPLLAKHGLSWTSRPAQTEDGGMVLVFKLAHTSGETDEGGMPLGVKAGCKPQELGSALTYARRYAITAQLNLATEDDDDGSRAQHAEPVAPTGPPYGPAMNPEFAALASMAATKLCGADDAAKKLWANLKKNCGGYMPQAVADAVVMCAEATQATPLDPGAPGVE